MQIRVGYEFVYDSPQPTPMILMVSIHPSRSADVVVADLLRTDPQLPVTTYYDTFGNHCSRLMAPAGELRLWTDALVNDTGEPDAVVPSAQQHRVEELPSDTLLFLLGSRYCETDLMYDLAWELFGKTAPGWSRVRAICDYVHQHIKFGYEHARATKTAHQVHGEQCGVCRDYTHLAISFLRCMNIPARYCTGYLGDIGVPVVGVMDFSAWLEAYIGGRWYAFDPRNKIPRIGRILMARGRDAADVAISTSFGPNKLKVFKVVSDEIQPGSPPQ